MSARSTILASWLRLTDRNNFSTAHLRDVKSLDLSQDVIGDSDSRTPLHCEMQNFAPGRAFEVKAPSGKRLRDDVINECAALRHVDGDSPVRWMRSLRFGATYVNENTFLTFGKALFAARRNVNDNGSDLYGDTGVVGAVL